MHGTHPFPSPSPPDPTLPELILLSLFSLSSSSSESDPPETVFLFFLPFWSCLPPPPLAPELGADLGCGVRCS